MLMWAIVFLVFAGITGFLSLTEVSSTFSGGARGLFVLSTLAFLVILLLTLIDVS